MALKDLDEIFDPDLKLPIRGKMYTVAAPGPDLSAHLRKTVLDTGVTLQQQEDDALRTLGAEQNDAGDWSGGVYSEMVADSLPWAIIQHAGKTAMVHYGFAPDMGEVYWHLSQLATSIDLDVLTSALAEQNAAKRGGH